MCFTAYLGFGVGVFFPSHLYKRRSSSALATRVVGYQFLQVVLEPGLGVRFLGHQGAAAEGFDLKGSSSALVTRVVGYQFLQVESLGGKRYFLSIVDDYSRRVWVYILIFKREAFGKFKEWKQLVENQTRRTVKKPRTDNGLEFCNREFEQLCIESGIARYLTVAEMPQQNGLAERMNRTLMDKVRCLLIQSGLPKTFWAKAACTAAYLINRSPSTTIEKKTPMEMWSGHPRYPEGVKGYRLYRLDDESPKIVTSRNVVFNESVIYKDTLKDSGVGVNKSVEELHVKVELQRLNNHTPEEDQEDDDDEDAGDQETDQTLDLTDYQLAQDRE
ncbi:retrovirus-related pol polyprotein from transposon TNT 1-94 [Tanacetum coccineum]